MADHEIAVQLTVVPAPIEIAGLLLKAVAYSRQAIGLKTRQLGGGNHAKLKSTSPCFSDWYQAA